MKAAVLDRRGPDGLNWREFPDPILRPGESILKVAASSLNRVDLYMRDNGAGITHTLPQILGVEAAGEIVETEPDSGLRKGAKAILYSVAFCGKCRFCEAGDQPRVARANPSDFSSSAFSALTSDDHDVAHSIYGASVRGSSHAGWSHREENRTEPMPALHSRKSVLRT